MVDKKVLLNEIKQLYVKYCEAYQVWQNAFMVSGESENAKVKLNEVKKITLDFEQKAKILFKLTVPDTEEYKRFAIILAYAWNARLDWMHKDPERKQDSIELVKKVTKHLEPYKHDLMAIYPYTFAHLIQIVIGQMHPQILANLSRKFTYGTETEINPKIYQAWDGAKLFEISVDEQTPDIIQYLETHNAVFFMETIGEFAIELMNNATTKVKVASKHLKSDDFSKKIEAIKILEKAARLFRDSCRFKQSLHLLSVAMFHLVKIRQHLPVDERPKLNTIQAISSHGFASYGMVLAKGSWIKYSHSNEYFDDADFEYFELTDLIEPGLEIYSSQFPIDYVDDPIELKKILKKSIAWNKRAIELGSAGDEYMKEYEAMKVTLTEMLTKLVEKEAAMNMNC